ncbi:AMP-binding protein [Streptomyces sp. Wb2n-11]|uniref:AMP-binding protein n=1 Tax=Streptomyces sp. Wb2n-11 TaxID=1030533 RepID=UPI000A477999|nr:AMP-binding protein [Streptomyces sp. Wb2n-11]
MPDIDSLPHSTLIEAVYAHARDGIAGELCAADHGAHAGEVIDYRTFWYRAVACALGLRQRGVRTGDHVALVMHTTLETMIATVGVQAAGGVLVPLRAVARPRPGSQHALRARDAMALGRARWCLTPPGGTDAYAGLARDAGLPTTALPVGEFVPAAPTPVSAPVPPPPVALDPNGAALLQFSSGSTSAPKGILLTHRNLAVNLTALNDRVGYHCGRGVFWLPLSHDMGLIGCFASSLFSGSSVRALPPESFVRDPLRWITELSDFRATHTAGPPFGYELAGRRARERFTRPSALDLSALEVALIGAERITPALCAEFERALAPQGLKPHVLLPAYGLAENCVAVAARRPLTPTTVRVFDRRALGEGRLVASEAPHGAAGSPPVGTQSLVGHGTAVTGTRVRVTALDGRRDALPDGCVGEIHVGGEAATARMVTGGRWEPVHPDGFVPTGDLGAYAEGELFVVGRLKETFKHAGMVYAPGDLEAVALAACPPSVTAAVVVPVTPEDEAAESVVLFLEISGSPVSAARGAGDAESGEDTPGIADTVRLAVLREFGMPVRDVFVVARGLLPRTASGKVQRTRLAAAYVSHGADGVPGRRQPDSRDVAT